MEPPFEMAVADDFGVLKRHLDLSRLSGRRGLGATKKRPIPYISGAPQAWTLVTHVQALHSRNI